MSLDDITSCSTNEEKHLLNVLNLQNKMISLQESIAKKTNIIHKDIESQVKFRERVDLTSSITLFLVSVSVFVSIMIFTLNIIVGMYR